MKITTEAAVDAAFDRAIADANAEEARAALRTMAAGLTTPPPSVGTHTDPQPRKRYTLSDPAPGMDNPQELFNYVQDTAQERTQREHADTITALERMTARHKAHEAAVAELTEKAFPPQPDDPTRAALREMARGLKK